MLKNIIKVIKKYNLFINNTFKLYFFILNIFIKNIDKHAIFLRLLAAYYVLIKENLKNEKFNFKNQAKKGLPGHLECIRGQRCGFHGERHPYMPDYGIRRSI